MNKNKKEKNTEKYDKSQLIHSSKYVAYKDILQVLLKTNEKYSTDEVDAMLKNFMKRKV